MEIMMVKLYFGDGLDDEYLMYGINKNQVSAAKEAIQRAEQKYDIRAIGESFEDVLEKEMKKAGIRFKNQGYHVANVAMNP